MNKKLYIDPELQIRRFEQIDVISTSNNTEIDDDSFDVGGNP